MVLLNGLTNAAALNGAVVQVLTASATQFTFNYTHANVTTGAETTGSVIPLVAPGGLPIVANIGAIALTNSTIASNVATFTANQNLNPNNLVYVANMTNSNGTPCIGYTVAVIASSLTNAAFKFNFGPTASLTSAADTGTVVPLVVGAGSGSASAELPLSSTLIQNVTVTVLVMTNR
jgi:hypothetical protein